MLGVLARGRLGNQMFQYAFIYALSKKLNKPFFIFKYNSLHYFKLYDELKKNNRKNAIKFAFTNLLQKSSIPLTKKSIKNLFGWIINWAVRKNVSKWEITLNNDSHLLTAIYDNTFYEGYFQSEDYFIDLKEEIYKLLEINPQYKEDFWGKKKLLFTKKVIAIHLRRTDYLYCGNESLEGKNISLPINYYRVCLSLIDDIDSYNVIFVSDDIESVKIEFGNKSNYFYENNSEIVDFQILQNADIVIIANSTFSWWAAWLNKKENKIIYAPNYFLGFNINQFYPAGIKVNSWNWIDVN